MARAKDVKPMLTINRRCSICGGMFILPHPNDPRFICEKCIGKLRKLIEEYDDKTNGTIDEQTV